MLITTKREPLEITVDSSRESVFIGPGAIQFGDTVAMLDGTKVDYRSMTTVYGNTDKYQLSVLSASYYVGMVDMTCYDSSMSTSVSSLAYPNPAMPTDARAIGVFTFHNTDGVVEVVSYSKVV